MTLIDASGTRHAPAGDGARIVSLVPSITELLIDLGLAGQLVGRTRFCVHPAAVVGDIPALGGTKKVNLRRLRALAPSHVILNIDENTAKMAAAIADVVPHVVVTHPLVPDDNPALYRLMGGLFGREAEAERLCAAYGAARDRLAARAFPPRRALYLIWRDPWMTVSRDTYVSATLALVNWATLGHDPAVRYPHIAITRALLADCDLILFSSEPYAFTRDHIDAFAAAHDCAGARLLPIDGEMTSWYGSRAIRGLDYLGAFAADLMSAA